MKTFAKTIAAIAIAFSATACDPASYVPGYQNGDSAVPCDPATGDSYTAGSHTAQSNQGMGYTAGTGHSDPGQSNGPSLAPGAPIADRRLPTRPPESPQPSERVKEVRA